MLFHVVANDGPTGTGETWWGRYLPDLPPGAPVAPLASLVDTILAPACTGAAIEGITEVEALDTSSSA